jgi:hypothetical protein
MALAKVANGSKLLIRIDDVGNPGTFAHRCSINTSRGITFGSSPAESLIPDCDAPDEPGWMNREIDGLTADIAGAGMLDSASLNFFWTWYLSGDSRNLQVALDVPLADGGGYWEGAAVLSTFEVSAGARREKIAFTSTMLSDGPFDWVPA